ncbi:putative oxidoreductase dhs-27 [Vespula squamosa]|uniref:Oxidoreductase dhs-27 n=1 Tax=Vespula squamosa TaxID=30214 RepID=A0ABD2A487_VESSQ
MSDCEDSEDSCGEEEVVPKWEVRKEWLESIFEKHFEEPVFLPEFEIIPRCTSNDSVLSDITYAKVIVYTKAVRRIIEIVIKRLPDDPFSRFFVTEGQYDLREIKFYTQIIPDLKKFEDKYTKIERINLDEIYDNPLKVPICYYAHYSPPGGTDDSPVPPESILVLSDVNAMSVKFSEGLTFAQAKAALDSIAGIHALSLCMKIIDGKPLPERYPFLFQKAKATDSYQQMVERGFSQLAHFLERVPGLETVLEALMALRPKTKDIIMTLLAPEGPLALITHTDFWCKNLQFDYHQVLGTKCYILDWQMVAYSRPTNDVALLLVSSLPSKLRRKHTESLLDAYWNALNESCFIYGVDIPKDLGYTRKDLAKDYRKSQLLALLLCIGSIDIALGHPQTEQRLIDVLQDLHNDGILTEEIAITTTEAEA